MDSLLTEDQITLRDMTREFARKTVAPLAAERDERAEFPAEEIEAGAQVGLLGLAVPEEFGGWPVDAVTMALVYEEISRASAAMSLILSVHNSLTSTAINRWGQASVREHFLPKLASGEYIGAYALTEPSAGSDAASIQTRAVRTDKGYVINGRKMFISSALHAGVFVVFTVTEPEERTSRRITAIAVERGTPGLKVGTKERKLGLLASEIAEVILDDCEVPAENVLGEPGRGFGIAMELLDAGRIGIAAQAAGIAAAALDASLSYATTREQFGRPISDYQAIQWKLADMATELQAARLMIWHAARLKDSGKPFSREASQAKLFASELANRAASQAVQIHGGYGYLKDFGVERLYRDAKATELYEGTSEIQRMVIARHLLREQQQAAR
jgi:alkylation response protein AidB-like acyl-CoA dehydrogenase